MIRERIPLSMCDVEEILEKIPEGNKKTKVMEFIKKFNKTKRENAKKIKEEIRKLDLAKIKEEHIVKIIDFLPSDTIDLNKIFTDVSLTEDEINKILEIVKNNQ